METAIAKDKVGMLPQTLARITEMVVDHHERKFGKSKYNITRTFRVIVDLMAMNLFIRDLKTPLRFFGKVGAWFLIFGAWPPASSMTIALTFLAPMTEPRPPRAAMRGKKSGEVTATAAAPSCISPAGPMDMMLVLSPQAVRSA